LNEVEIACLPANLPEFLEVNLSEFDIGDIVRLSDIKLPEGVTLTAFTHGDIEEHDIVVVSASHVKGGASESDEEEGTQEEGTEEEA
jgi:large subunit ribosomal protein L25